MSGYRWQADGRVYELVDNPKPNAAELELAKHLARGARPDELGMRTVAEYLALAREGHTLEGPRSLVEARVTISRHALDRQGGEVERTMTRQLWHRWLDQLVTGGLRPVGWPTVTRTHLTYGLADDDDRPARRRGLTEVDPGRGPWDVLELRLVCEAVPAA